MLRPGFVGVVYDLKATAMHDNEDTPPVRSINARFLLPRPLVRSTKSAVDGAGVTCMYGKKLLRSPNVEGVSLP